VNGFTGRLLDIRRGAATANFFIESQFVVLKLAVYFFDDLPGARTELFAAKVAAVRELPG
jgi:hypothetical protein